MENQDFQNKIFEALSGIESRLEKRLDIIEAQRKADNERLEKRLDSMETHVLELRQDIGWVKGKLESKNENKDKVLNVSILSTSTVAIIISLIALFN